MNKPTTLEDYYRYWDEFVDEWMQIHNSNKLQISHIGNQYDIKWTIPQKINGYNNPNVETIQYLPEPWWGNDGTHTFQAVFINLNPGRGGIEQSADYVKYLGFNSFRRYVSNKVDTFVSNKEFKIYINNKYQKSTTEWLLTQRTKPFFNAIELEYFSVRNVIGIDLIPWHTPSFNQISKEYISSNAKAICNYSIKFALAASREIQGILKNVVIARVPCHLFIDILRLSNEIKIVESYYYFEKSKNEIYTLSYNGERFYVMVLTGARNNLPSKHIIKKMLSLIKTYQLTTK